MPLARMRMVVAIMFSEPRIDDKPAKYTAQEEHIHAQGGLLAERRVAGPAGIEAAQEDAC